MINDSDPGNRTSTAEGLLFSTFQGQFNVERWSGGQQVVYLPIRRRDNQEKHSTQSNTMSKPSESRTGACLCGKIKYLLQGKAATPIHNTVCHCLSCQRITGSALLVASIVHKEV